MDLGQQFPVQMLRAIVEPGDRYLQLIRQLLKFLLWKIISELGIENIKR